MSGLSDDLFKYVDLALSKANRKKFDGDSNAPYRVVIELAEVGAYRDDPAGFSCEVRVPRQVDNALGCTIAGHFSTRQDAAKMLRDLANKLEGGL